MCSLPNQSSLSIGELYRPLGIEVPAISVERKMYGFFCIEPLLLDRAGACAGLQNGEAYNSRVEGAEVTPEEWLVRRERVLRVISAVKVSVVGVFAHTNCAWAGIVGTTPEEMLVNSINVLKGDGELIGLLERHVPEGQFDLRNQLIGGVIDTDAGVLHPYQVISTG